MKMKYWKKEARAGAFCGQRLKKTKERVVLLCGGGGGNHWLVLERRTKVCIYRLKACSFIKHFNKNGTPSLRATACLLLLHFFN